MAPLLFLFYISGLKKVIPDGIFLETVYTDDVSMFAQHLGKAIPGWRRHGRQIEQSKEDDSQCQQK